MTLDLPTPVANYFCADKSDSEAVAQCFTENAVVKDEGHTFKGRAAIRQWKARTSGSGSAAMMRAGMQAELVGFSTARGAFLAVPSSRPAVCYSASRHQAMEGRRLGQVPVHKRTFHV